MKLIETTVRVAAQFKTPVNVCGEMSGVPAYAVLLLGLGVRGLSVAPAAIPEVKNVCRSITISHCQEIAQKAMSMESAREIDTYLQEELRKTVPELTPES